MSRTPGSGSDGRRMRLFASLCGMIFLVNFGRVAFAPLLEPFMRTFGVGEATAGLVATLAWLGSALPRLPTGYLLTRVTRSRVILASTGLLAVAAAFTAAAPGVALLGVGAFLVGSSSGVYFMAANPLVSELFPDRVGRALSVHATSSQVAAVAAPLLVAGALLAGAWWWVFAGLALGALVVAGALFVTLRGATLPTAGDRDRDLLAAARAEWPTIVAAVLVLGSVGFVWNGLFNFYVPFLASSRPVSLGTANVLLTVLFAVGIPAMLVAGRLTDRFSLPGIMLATLVAFAASLLGLTVAEGLAALALVTVALGLAFHGLIVVIDTYLLSSFPDDRRASAYATYSASMMVVQAMGSVVLGTLVESGVGYDAAFRTFGAALGAVAVGLLVLHAAGRFPGTTAA